MASASLNQRYCSLCAEDHENEVATVWCPECHDALCSTCSKHHRRSRNSKHHVVVQIEDFEKLPKFLQSQPDLCPDHECSFDLYCKKHEAPCCVKCLPEYHSPCCSSAEITSLIDVIKNVKSSVKLETIETFLKLVIEDYRSLEKHITSNLEDAQTQVRDCMTNFKAMRLTIEKYLDYLEDDIQKQLQLEESKINRHFQSIRNDLHLKKDSAEMMSQDLIIMKNIATERQVFFALPELEKSLETHKGYIKLLTSEKKLSKQKLTLKFSEMKNIKKQLLSVMCKLSSTIIPFDVKLNIPRQEKKQLLAPVMSTTSINGIVLTFKTKVDLKRRLRDGNIEGCTISSIGNIFLICSKTRTLYIYETQSKLLRSISKFAHDPLGVAVSSNGNRIFVSSNNDYMMSIDTATEGNTTSIPMNCYDVDHFNGNIFGSSFGLRKVFWGKPENQKFNEFPVAKDVYCVSASNVLISCTNFDDDTVSCFGYNGEPKWQYKNTELKSPIGITSTASGIVFVTCRSSDNVHVISADGKEHRIILCKTDGMNCPRAINYSNERKELLVINEYTAELFLYDVVL